MQERRLGEQLEAVFSPDKIGERLLIRPTWEDEYDAEGRAVLHLEPGLAFGTGSHETTRLCLEALEKNIKGGEKVLDVGCGSGILAIASLLLGAESATGVDIDELAVKTAEENGKMNGFGSDRLTFIHGDLADKVSGKFDIVVANIVADVIIMFCKTVPEFMADNAVFITSGIIDIREQEVVGAFAENGFEIIARHADGGWRCFECRRKSKHTNSSRDCTDVRFLNFDFKSFVYIRLSIEGTALAAVRYQ